jgi:hypothetical protein
MRRFISSFTLALSTAAAPLWAQPAAATTIDHQGVACIIAGKYPKLVACLGSEITGGKAWFHAQDDPAWYWVNKSDQKVPPETVQPNLACSVWVLPRPGRKLVNKHIEYYIEAGSSRTGEFDPLVVRRALECKKNAPVAPTSPTGPAGVFPSLAPGFMGNFPTAAVLTTAAVGGGLAALLASGGENAVTPPPTGTPPAAPPPPPPPPPTEPPSVSPLALSCQADPKSGDAPLKVSFAGFPSGGTGIYDFHWTFGDGETSNGKQPTHTYTSPGSYDATLNVTSGDQVRQCVRGITVDKPPAGSFRLSITKSGAGTGTVTDDHGKIDCGVDCTATYVRGTQVALKQTAAPGSAFGGWSGDCTGMGSCVVTTDANKSVTARFDLAAPPPPPPPPKVKLDFTAVEEEGCGDLTFNIDPPGTGCTADVDPGKTCTETYPAGTDVSIESPTVPEGCGDEVCWSGACFGTPTTPGSVCKLTMDTDKVAGANIIFGSCNGDIESSGPHRELSWVFQLDVPGALGQAVVDGAIVVAESGRRVQAMARKREGEAVVAATLVKGAGQPGTWRFEAQEGETLEPGSLRVLRGEVALLTPTAVVFRLRGTAGEQVAFSYRLRR